MFNHYQNNDLKIRADTFYANHYKKWNPIKNNWDEIGAGGDEHPVELPYYIQTSDIDFGSLVINPDGVTLGDAIGNETLTVGNIREDRNKLNAIETTVNAQQDVIDNHTNEIQDLDQMTTTNLNSIQALQSTVGGHTTSISTLNTKTSGISYNTGGTGNTQIGNSNKLYYVTVEDGLRVSKYPSINNNNPYLLIKNTSIDIWDPIKSNAVFMNYSRIDNLAKLETICTSTFNDKIDFTKKVGMSGIPTTGTTNKKMVVLDSTTKELSMTDIPTTPDIPEGAKNWTVDMNGGSATYLLLSLGTGNDQVTNTTDVYHTVQPSHWNELIIRSIKFPSNLDTVILDFTNKTLIINQNETSKDVGIFFIQGDTQTTTWDWHYIPSTIDGNNPAYNISLIPVFFKKNYNSSPLITGRLIRITKTNTTAGVSLKGKIIMKQITGSAMEEYGVV